jgi:hypothetical protein
MSELRLVFMHASPEVEAVVREWFEARALPCKLDGDRSVRIAHPDYEGMDLKIKGAGFRGGPIRYGQFNRSNLRAPVFDFEGRMTEDVASGHDNALLGAASFQQAVAEFRMSLFLRRIHVPHVLCTAYGKLETDDATTWFSLHDWDPRMVRVVTPNVTAREFVAAKIHASKQILDLALRYNIIGYCAYGRIGREYFLYDLHPFRQLDAFNMSQISWVMHVIFNLHIMALDIISEELAAEFPQDAQAFPFRCALPDASRDDHEELRWTVIAPYMLACPKEFSMRVLCAALARNRISRALLELCPREFERP